MAQLVLLPMFKSNKPFCKRSKGNSSFSSTEETGIYWVAELDKRPSLELIIDGKKFPGLLDTRADASVISIRQWPKAWPLQQAPSMV